MMAAVLGLATAQVEAACKEASRQGSVAVAANLNGPDQTVISGDPDAVARAGEACKARGAKRVMPLKVSGAFHSPLMAPAKNHLQLALEKAPFQDPAFPVIANATAEAVKDTGRAVASSPISSRRRCGGSSACSTPRGWQGRAEVRWVEIGPGAVLAGLLKRIVPGRTW